MLEIIARKWAARTGGEAGSMLDGKSSVFAPDSCNAHTRGGSIYLLAGGQLHEAADKSRIPDPVQFYIYRRRGVCGEEHGHAYSLLSLSLRLSFIIPHLCSNRVPRFSRRCSFPSFSRSRKEKQRKRVTEREGCPCRRGGGEAPLRWSCDCASERDGR